MDTTILWLLMAGVALAFLHTPTTMVHLAIITCLLLMTVKFLWAMLQQMGASRDLPAR